MIMDVSGSVATSVNSVSSETHKGLKTPYEFGFTNCKILERGGQPEDVFQHQTWIKEDDKW